MINKEHKVNFAAPQVGQDDFDKVYSDVAQYGRVRFWDDRYLRDPEPFEWYYPYETFKEIINDCIAKEAKILIAGCGNSHFMEDLYDDGFLDITAMDVSRVVIDQVRTRCAKDYPEIKFINGNMSDSNMPGGSYDAIIDKAMFDSILCGLKGEEVGQSVVKEVERLLTTDGLYMSISHATPEERLKYFEIYDLDDPLFTPWYTDVIAIEKPKETDAEILDTEDPNNLYYVYICRKDIKLVRQKEERARQLAAKAKKAKNKKNKGKNPL